MAEELNFISLHVSFRFFFWLRTITLTTAELPLSIPYIYYHFKFRKHYSKTKMRNMYIVICTGSGWLDLYFFCLKFRSKICQLIQRHYGGVKHLQPFKFYRAQHAVKRGLGFQNLIRLPDFGLFCLTSEKISDIHCIKGRSHWRWRA